MAPFDRSCTTSYQSAIVTTVPSCTIFEIFDLEEYRDIEILIKVTRSPVMGSNYFKSSLTKVVNYYVKSCYNY